MKELKDWHKQALKMREEGYKSRAIAEKLLGKESSKSSVNYFFNDYDNGLYSLIEKERKSLNGVSLSECFSIKALEIPKKELKLLYFDLETSPEEGYFWNRWKTNISEPQVKRHSHLLTASWAVNDGEVQSTKLSHKEVMSEDDLTSVVNMVQAINSADVIVGFNSKKFDIKYLKTRMIKWDLPPLKPVKHVDIYQIARAQMRFPSNSMNNIAKYLGYSVLKQQTGGFDLWRRCLSEDKLVSDLAMEHMESYNIVDITVTRNLYKQFQGWSTGVNIGAIVNQLTPESQTLRCTKCGSDDMFVEDGFAYTATIGFQLYRCGCCRGVSRINSRGDKLVGVV